MAERIRLNPLGGMGMPKAPQMPSANFQAPVQHMANRVGGAMHSYLGHFAQLPFLKAGHNTSGHWEEHAVKHPGVEKARARRNGISTHQQLERDSHSSNPTLRRRGNLGLTFERQAHGK